MVWGSRGNPVKEAGVGGGEWWRRGLGLSLSRTQAQSPSLSQRPQIRSPHRQRTQVSDPNSATMVAIAAMDCQHFDVAEARLEGMLLEAKGSCAELEKAYTHLLEDNPLDQVLYTLGSSENLQMAKKYYASTINLTGGKNSRALFGICLCSAAISQLARGQNREENETSELPSLAATALMKDYKHRTPSKFPLLTSTLKNMKLLS
ncbi:ER membrane protein complex subunit 2-A [Cinnamomum micranthum f. kanehirae]|uniref:ER membrane protein complex subunit 2 n=1 Tax=Cinnamomum micranthum f. kanehirae TaxID=337451 RepID=A0A3S3N7I3_9MAGN|nr:ER membrane protein complex subunit 2-A [Cinnamomum micranthum f. kanehirae]